MAHQSPLISIPKKTTTEVDWSTPIRTIIAQSFGEDPKGYAEEISVLTRCRQDAVKGAGSDHTARDLLYKYFGQLELLELRFAEIKVSFPWNDAFTSKLTTQTSLAFEKASIIHLLSSVLSTLASSSSRSDPEGLKRAYYNSRATSGMLTYINENFLHAPSTDLSREVIHFLINLTMAQATEIFTEKLVDEKKSPGLISRSANTTAGMYAGLVEEMKDFQGKGIFDKNWLGLISIKAKLFGSAAQYYKSLGDGQSGKHGVGLVRLRVADTLAQEAYRQAQSFVYTFSPPITTTPGTGTSPSLPTDSATNMLEITKAHSTLCGEAKTQAVKDNDLIYHDILPSEASLPAIEKLPPAAPITIQEVYGNPEVSKLIGQDIFGRLIPLAVHESASVYSEEKAKVVRGEVERVDLSEGEVRAGLEYLGLPGLLRSWERLVDGDGEGEGNGEGDVEVSSGVMRLAREVGREAGMEAKLRGLQGEREGCERELRELSAQLDNESRECERMRAKYAPQFTQSPSGRETAHLRSSITSNLNSLTAAASSDSDIAAIYKGIQPDIAVLASGESGLRDTARKVAAGRTPLGPASGVSLLDLDEDVGTTSGLEEQEREGLRKAIDDAKERLDRLGKIRRERDEVLKELKEKIQTDDVSSLLLLNRRSGNVEPQLFASELEKFRPYQSRLASAVQASKSILQELEMLVKQVEKGKGVKERQRSTKDRTRRVRDWERKLETAGEEFAAVQAGLSKGLTYYDGLRGVIDELKREVGGFVRGRESERGRLVSDIEMRQRLAASAPPPPPSSTTRGLEAQLAGMSLGGGTGDRYGSSSGYSPSPPPPPQSRGISVYSSTPSIPPPPPHPSTPSHAPPPPPQQPSRAASSPYDFGSLGNLPSTFSTGSASPSYPSAPPPSNQQNQQRQPAYPPSSSYSSGSSSAYPPPPPPNSQPPRPTTNYPSYIAPTTTSSYTNSNPYPPPPPSHSPYPAPPPSIPSRQSSTNAYYTPPSQPGYNAPSPPPPGGYQNYTVPPQQYSQQPHYQPQPPQPPQPPQGQYGGYQPSSQGYGYGQQQQGQGQGQYGYR